MVVISGLSRSSNSYALTIRSGILFALIQEIVWDRGRPARNAL